MLPTDFLQAALDLAELGYEVFPLYPKEKRPCAPLVPHGVSHATDDPGRIREWWEKQPDCNIGLRCRNLLVLDLDNKPPEKNGSQDMENIVREVGRLEPETVSRTGTGGFHLLFRRPIEDVKGSNGILWHGIPTAIDVQVGNQYIVAPPSIHPDTGEPYRWESPPVHVAQLSSLPQTWIERVLPKREAAVTIQLKPREHVTTGEAIERCRRYLEEMPPAVSGCGGHTATLRAANVIFHGFGLSEPDGWPLLQQYNARCEPPWNEKQLQRKMSEAIYNPPTDRPRGHLLESNNETQQVDITALLRNIASESLAESDDDFEAEEEEAVDLVTPDVEPLPEHLRNVPGFIGRYVDFCMEGAPHPNKPLALFGGLALLSFLVTRKVQSVSGIMPNIYVIELARSGTGKDYAREVNKHILIAAGQAVNCLDDIASGEGLEDAVLQNRKVLFQPDEVQTMFQNIARGKESRYTNIISALLRLYTTSGGVLTRRTASVKARGKSDVPEMVNLPGLILLGTTIPRGFLATLNETLMTSGLGSRCLFVGCDPRSPRNRNAMPYSKIPQTLIETAKFWTEFQPPDPETGQVGNMADVNPTPLVIPIDGAADSHFSDFSQKVDEKYNCDSDEISQTLWTRAYENAMKLALLYACSEDPERPRIGLAAAQWSCETTQFIISSMIKISGDHIAENPFHNECQRVRNFLQKSKTKQLNHAALLRKMKIPTKMLREIVETMIEQKEIEQIVPIRRGGGIAYKLRKGKKSG